MAKSQHAARYRNLPGLLKKMRGEAGLTQRQLGEKLNVSHVFVHKSEIGERRVDITEFMDWCVACKVPPDQGWKALRGLRGI